MRVIQGIVSVLTIPFTSAVCSCAAVAYIQHNRSSHGMSMRKTMALADRGWTDPTTYVRILSGPDGYKRVGSVFLIVAMVLNILGGIIQPLQQVLLSTRSIKTPDSQWPSYGFLDIKDQFNPYYTDIEDNQLTVLMTRDSLNTVRATELMPQLWHGGNFTCDEGLGNVAGREDDFNLAYTTCGSGSTLGHYSWNENTFLSQLANTFSSGLLRQFAPQFNSSASYESVEEDLFPRKCADIEGSFYSRFTSNASDTDSVWSIEVCMPADQTQSPWKNTRERQDFSEELFLNISTSDGENSGSIFRLTLSTTAGFFELPNVMNDELPGPLLDTDPNNYCDSQCKGQGYTSGTGSDDYSMYMSIYDHTDQEQKDWYYRPDKRSPEDLTTIEKLRNKGPLLTIALALFGQGSFIEASTTRPESIIESARDLPNNTCTGFAPLNFLMQDTAGTRSWEDSDTSTCLISNATLDAAALDLQLRTWIRMFDNQDNEQMTAAMNAAAFLATKAWIENQVPPSSHSFSVAYDQGKDSLIPDILLAGVVVISVLYFVFLVSLFGMATYASFTHRWTRSLDSFTMMRFGAAMGEDLPLRIGNHQSKVRVLDEAPGWIGDRDQEGEAGTLGLGAGVRLRKGRRYRSYEGDHEKEPFAGNREQFNAIRMREIREDLEDSRPGGRSWRVEPADDANAARL